MKFRSKSRRPPTIIIISLIDILIVLLIFLLVTTTFKRQPAVQIALPESTQSEASGVDENITLVTLSRDEPFIHLGEQPIVLEELRSSLGERARVTPEIKVIIASDEGVEIGRFVEVMDAITAAGIRNLKLRTRPKSP